MMSRIQSVICTVITGTIFLIFFSAPLMASGPSGCSAKIKCKLLCKGLTSMMSYDTVKDYGEVGTRDVNGTKSSGGCLPDHNHNGEILCKESYATDYYINDCKVSGATYRSVYLKVIGEPEHPDGNTKITQVFY